MITSCTVTRPIFCTNPSERVYITAWGCEIGSGRRNGLQAPGAGGLNASILLPAWKDVQPAIASLPQFLQTPNTSASAALDAQDRPSLTRAWCIGHYLTQQIRKRKPRIIYPRG